MKKKATKADCVCEKKSEYPLGVHDPGNPSLPIIYNVFCPFHKGEDKGYGWDNNGVPVTKFANAFGTVAATLVVGGSLVAIAVLVVMAFLKW
jgi:hypothetical protein